MAGGRFAALCGALFDAAALVAKPCRRCRRCSARLTVQARHVVQVWGDREIRALRDARRMSLREFAEYLGVSARVISKWEAGARPRPVNQHALDSALDACDGDERERFAQILGVRPVAVPPHRRSTV